jgi:Fur family ferric uptake transcriptional regulator
MRRPQGHHHHLVCTGCGTVADFTGCDLAALEKRVAGETGFVVDGHILELVGLCRDCQNSAKRQPNV